jgi:MFS superfamily sulfate permease-like transporter
MSIVAVSISINIHCRFRSPQAPSFVLLPSLVKDAIIIAIVSYAICMSLAKTYAKKFKYMVDANQELAAYSLCNVREYRRYSFEHVFITCHV